MKRKLEYSDTSPKCPTCGSPRYKVPPSNGTFVEQTTYIGNEPRYLVRAHMDIGPPIILHPFAILEIGAFGRRPGFRWQVSPRVCTLFPPFPLYTFADAEKLLKQWAETYVASALDRLVVKKS